MPTDPQSTELLEAAEVTATLTPLLELCRRNNRPTDIDAAGIETLRRMTIDELRYGIHQVCLQVPDGRLHRPLGFLVAKARTSPEFFTAVPPLPDQPADDNGIADVGIAAITDPAVVLSAAQLHAVDAEITNPATLPAPALAALRNEIARRLFPEEAPR